jgi:methylenetetrahydrofolate dehydrogenase (NADP+)/methenyltetrahydrofolate cyclohydrolase
MVAKILSGKIAADAVKTTVSAEIQQRRTQGLSRPGLAVILVGDNPASEAYVRHKQKACEEVGIHSICHRLAATCSQQAIEDLIDQSNQDPTIHGILLQLPLPKHIQAEALLERIDYRKDVDGFHPYNLGRLIQRRPMLRPCTPYGVITLLKNNNINLAGVNAVVVGASNIVGRPMALELLLTKSTVTICHRFTHNLQEKVQAADLLVVAIGNPTIIKSEWIKPGAVVVDIGFNRKEDGSIVGDIDYPSAAEKASWLTPVPGGIGLMTVAILLQNTLLAAKIQENNICF